MKEATIRWTVQATESVAVLLDYIGAQPYGNRLARAREIYRSVRILRSHPEAAPVEHIRGRKQYRRLVIGERFYVYYIYYPAKTQDRYGIVSVRSVKHSALRHPFAGVRESPMYGYTTVPDFL